MNFSNLDPIIEKIVPLISAIIAGIFSWILTNQTNNNKRLEKEYKYLDVERQRLQEYFEGELRLVREEKKIMQQQLSDFKKIIESLQEECEECQERLSIAMELIKKKQV